MGPGSVSSAHLFGIIEMNLLTALKRLKKINMPVMRTWEAAAVLGVSNEHASQMLRRLALGGHIVHLSRGHWVIQTAVSPFLLSEYLVAPFPSYVSLQTALYHHGMIDQIPRLITIVSVARTRRIHAPFATVSVHHVAPQFFFGYDVDPNTGVKMATPEKALVDVFYLSPAKSGWFKTLPEVELPPSFDAKKALAMVKKIPFPSRRTLVEKALRPILQRQ